MKTLIVLVGLIGFALSVPQIVSPIKRSRQILITPSELQQEQFLLIRGSNPYSYGFQTVSLDQQTPELLRLKADQLEAWNNAGFWDGKQANLKGNLLLMNKEEMDKWRMEMMEKEKKGIFDKKEIMDKKDMFEKKTLLPEPVKDTAEVELAKREHFRAHEIAKARLQIESGRIPIIYTNLPYGGSQNLAAVRSFDSVFPGHTSQTQVPSVVKFVNTVGPTPIYTQ